jgi:hypothetical protein
VDPRRSIRAAHDPGLAEPIFGAFERIGEGFAFKPSGVRQHITDGGTRYFRIVEWQDNIRQQDARTLAFGDLARLHQVRTDALGDPLGLLLNEVFLRLGDLRPEPLLLLGTYLFELLLLDDASGGQAETVSKGTLSIAIGRRLVWSCATGGTSIGGPSKTSRSGLPTTRSIMLRSRSCPPAPTVIQPNPAS